MSEADVFSHMRESVTFLTQRQLHKVKKIINKELESRYLAAEALKGRATGAFQGMANFMAGVTWALACRASLRESKGHLPAGGVRPQSGEMWLPRELLTAVRHQVKARGWHPITSTDWDTVRANLSAEALAASRPPRHRDEPMAVKFAVRMAAPTYTAQRVSRLAMEDFDFGGEA